MDKVKYNAILQEIERLQGELEKLNPYANLKNYSNLKFGQDWSEPWIVKHCPTLSRDNGAGHDLYSEKYGKIEVKSSRLPMKNGWTMNQVHPHDCDYFLFVKYDCEEGTEECFLIPSEDIKAKFSYTAQHERESKENASCVSVHQTRANEELLYNEYFIGSLEDLAAIV